jgi:hypothetical protein
VWKFFWEQKTVSISILTENEAGGHISLILCLLFYLFGCACEFAYFHILTNMVNNKAGMQRGGDGCQWEIRFP